MSKVHRSFVGIDISKDWFDAAVDSAELPDQVTHQQFRQNAEGFKSFLNWLLERGVLADESTPLLHGKYRRLR